jgi:hypothetical protein
MDKLGDPIRICHKDGATTVSLYYGNAQGSQRIWATLEIPEL